MILRHLDNRPYFRMKLVVIIALLACVRSLRIFENGVVLERSGNLYINNEKSTFIVNVHRQISKTALERSNIGHCANQNNETSLVPSVDIWTKVCDSLKRETQNLWFRNLTRNKRSFLGLLLGSADFAWDALQQHQINDLRHLALESAKTADTLSKVVLENRNELTVQNEFLNHNLDRIEKEICSSNVAIKNMLIENHADEIAQTFLSQVESEIASLIEGTIPTTLQYINLFNGICRRSCSEIDEEECRNYCEILLSDLPSDFKPSLLKFIVAIDGVVIKVRFILPRIKRSSSPLYAANSLAIIKPAQKHRIKESVIIPEFASEIDNTIISLIHHRCEHTRANLICPQNALIRPSCLEDATCQTISRSTHDRCTYTYTKSGAVLSSLGNVSLAEFEDNQIKPDPLTGLFYIQSSNFDKTISCAGQILIVPALHTPITINVTFEMLYKNLRLEKPFQVNISHHIQKFSDEIGKIRTDHTILVQDTFNKSLMFIGIIIFMVLIIAGLVMYIVFRFRSQKQTMRTLHNSLLPSL